MKIPKLIASMKQHMRERHAYQQANYKMVQGVPLKIKKK